MSTDHTNESSWDAGVDPATHQPFVVPGFKDVGEVDQASDDSSPKATQDPVAEVEEADEAQEHSKLEQEQDQDVSVDQAASPQADQPTTMEESLRESLRDAEQGVIEFRVIHAGSPIRRLRLTGNRYTFGSAEGCSIRLNDHGLRPMHAVLMRDASRILVRAYSFPIQVNGVNVTEAELHQGDVLQLGSYRFELLNAQHDAEDGSPSQSDRRWSSVLDRPRSVGMRGSSFQLDRLSNGSIWSNADDLVWKERLRREVEQWRERQAECDRRESRCDQREANLRNRESELWSRVENLHRREARLQSQEAAAIQLYDEFAKHQQELIEVRDAAQRRQETFHQREISFRNQELEYRERLDEANRQLKLSQQQADSASQAVEEMRQQFDALNQQIEALSEQQSDTDCREQVQLEEQKRLIAELEAARDQALDDRADSEAQRRELESKLDRLENQLALLQKERGDDVALQAEKLAESEQLAQTLRQQVDELQQNLARATEESLQLRSDYEEALASVSELESAIAERSEFRDQDRETWEIEADELRASMERLSEELDQANRELEHLRDANAQLTARLDEMQQQRDEAMAEANARPTFESVQSMQEELTFAKDHLAEAQAERQEALQQLSEVQKQRENDQEKASHDLAAALAAAEQAHNLAAELQRNLDETASVEADPETDDVRAADEVLEDHSNDFLVIDEQPADEDDEYFGSDQPSDWNLESPDPAETPAEGSLANMLIHDLDQEARESRERDPDSETEPPSDWDQERGEEAYATQWSNHSDGYRIEEIEQPEDAEADEAYQGDVDQDAEIAQRSQDPNHAEADLDEDTRDELIAAEALDVNAAVNAAAASAPEEDDSIEAYMNRLLRRAQGQPLEDLPPTIEAIEKPVEATVDHEATEETAELDPNTPLIPRSKAPEGKSSLSAMRDLANASARTAISHSVRVQTRNIQLKGVFSLACALGAVACGLACYFFIPGVMRYLAVVMTAVVACIYVHEGWQLFREASRHLKEAELRTQPSNATKAENGTENEAEKKSDDELPTS